MNKGIIMSKQEANGFRLERAYNKLISIANRHIACFPVHTVKMISDLVSCQRSFRTKRCTLGQMVDEVL